MARVNKTTEEKARSRCTDMRLEELKRLNRQLIKHREKLNQPKPKPAKKAPRILKEAPHCGYIW